MNASQMIELISYLRDAYPTQPMPDDTIKLWQETLGDLPYEPTKKVIIQWIQTSEWAPKISQIRVPVLDAISGYPTPDEAWMMVLKYIKNTYPGWDNPKFTAPEPVVRAVFRFPENTRTIRMGNTQEMEKKFKSYYADEIKREQTPELGGGWSALEGGS